MRVMMAIGLIGMVIIQTSRMAVADELEVITSEIKSKRPINMTTLRVLSFLPINSPAFFYARRPVAGTVTTVFQVGSLAMGILGTSMYISAKNTKCGTDFIVSGLCEATTDVIGKKMGIVTMATGYGMWLATYIYAMTKAPRAAEEYNSLVTEQRIRPIPTAWATRDGGALGLGGRF